MICRRCGATEYPSRNMHKSRYRCRACGGVLDFEEKEISQLDAIRKRQDRLSGPSECEGPFFKFAFVAWPGRCVSPPVYSDPFH